jgi:hypothetical protein
MSHAASPLAEPPRLNEGQRLAYAFTAPSRLFADVRLNRSWWAPLIVVTIVSIVFVVAIEQKVGWTQVATNMMSADPKQSERFEQMPPEQRAGAYSMVGNFMRYTSYASPVFTIIFGAIIGGILLAVFNFGMGAQHSFKYAFAATIYAFMPPGCARALVGALTLFAGADPEGFMLDSPVASNLGMLVNRAESPAAYVLASSFDAFTIWMIILLGFAFSTGTKIKRGTAIGAIAGVYAVVVIVRTVWAAVMS